MKLSLPARLAFVAFTVLTLAFLYLPLLVVARLSFNPQKSVAWPGWTGWTTDWWTKAWQTDAPREALLNSCKVAFVAMLLAMFLGTLAAMAMARFGFFGKNAVSFLLVLPIALPGIVTGIALQNTFSREFDLGLFSFKVGFGFHSLVIAHATFCVVVAYNNVVARLRRSSPNLLEASADLGAHGSQTFRFITFPLMRSALVAGGILAFALSFDEIVVTTFTAGSGFQTLPVWIYSNFSRPNNVPLVNVVATFVMIVSIPLAWLAQRLSEGGDG
jgi:putative spermidine/putrescine transport system permease protein